MTDDRHPDAEQRSAAEWIAAGAAAASAAKDVVDAVKARRPQQPQQPEPPKVVLPPGVERE